MEIGERVAKLEQRAGTTEDEILRLRDGHHEMIEKFGEASLTAAAIGAKVDSFLANAPALIEQTAYRVYARVKAEERKGQEEVAGISAKFLKVFGGLVAIIGALIGLKSGGLLP